MVGLACSREKSISTVPTMGPLGTVPAEPGSVYSKPAVPANLSSLSKQPMLARQIPGVLLYRWHMALDMLETEGVAHDQAPA